MNIWGHCQHAPADTLKQDVEESPSPPRADPTDSSAAVQRLEALLAREVAERQRLQAELELRHCALDSASTHFMITDQRERGRIIYANRALARDHGYEPGELIGRMAAQL